MELCSLRNIKVEKVNLLPIEEQMTEIVERKGLGHPDSIADGLAEEMSRALCREYKKRFGYILHHNTDETQLVGGRTNPVFGGGEVISPIYILLVGRATKEFNGEEIPADTIALRAAKDYLKKNFPHLKDEHYILDCRIGQGSSDLIGVFKRENDVPYANDTSFGVGYAPFSETEQLVYATERYIVDELRKKDPAIGEDVKVMGARYNDVIDLTIACAMVSPELEDAGAYEQVKEEVQEAVMDIVPTYTERKVNVFINTADNPEANDYYLTVTGTSAEMGDDGSVGRGNRANGLITPYRPMSIEATSGKNPINHVGKIYNLLSNSIAHDVAELEGVQEVYVRVLSQIGKPIDEPMLASVQVIPEKGTTIPRIEKDVTEIADGWLADIKRITELVTAGKLSTF